MYSIISSYSLSSSFISNWFPCPLQKKPYEKNIIPVMPKQLQVQEEFLNLNLNLKKPINSVSQEKNILLASHVTP